MASVRSTLWTIFITGMLFGVVAVAALGWSWWTQRAIQQDLSLAATRLAEGKPADADSLLASHLDRERPSGNWVNQAVELRLDSLGQLAEKTSDPKQQGQYRAQAQTLADRVLDPKKPWVSKGQSGWIRSHIVLAEAAMDSNNVDAANPHIDAVMGLPEGTPGREAAILFRCRIKMATDQVAEAQKELEGLKAKLPETSPILPGVEKALGLCNMTMLKSPTPDPAAGDEIYVLQKGDTLDRLRKKFKVSPEILTAINYPLDPKRLTINRRIKIPHLELAIVVNKSDNTLTLTNHGKFFKKYRIRTGKEDYMTPVGDYKITLKQADPPWRNPKTGQSFEPGAAGNELGCRWMSFQGPSLGIHEASDPNSIGRYSSNGCVGMLKDDVIELFDLVPMGTPVKITGRRSQALMPEPEKAEGKKS